eukprot:SAG22_NODE_178_length_16142_cov_13.187995_9_plen_124_part_00
MRSKTRTQDILTYAAPLKRLPVCILDHTAVDEDGARKITLTTGNASGAPMIGISAGVHDLINVVLDPALPRISSGRNAQDVVEVMSGFVLSAHSGNGRVSLPMPRAEVGAEAAVELAAVAARL